MTQCVIPVWLRLLTQLPRTCMQGYLIHVPEVDMREGTPWGMIRARQERDQFSGRVGYLRQTVLDAIEEALAELMKPRGSKKKVKEILNALRSEVSQPWSPSL